MSASAPQGECCKTHNLCLNDGILLWTPAFKCITVTYSRTSVALLNAYWHNYHYSLTYSRHCACPVWPTYGSWFIWQISISYKVKQLLFLLLTVLVYPGMQASVCVHLIQPKYSTPILIPASFLYTLLCILFCTRFHAIVFFLCKFQFIILTNMFWYTLKCNQWNGMYMP